MFKFSKDYNTFYVKADLSSEKDVAEVNQKVKLQSKEFFIRDPRMRAFVQFNTELTQYFKDVPSLLLVEPDDILPIEYKAKKKLTLEELNDKLGWVYRVTLIKG